MKEKRPATLLLGCALVWLPAGCGGSPFSSSPGGGGSGASPDSAGGAGLASMSTGGLAETSVGGTGVAGAPTGGVAETPQGGTAAGGVGGSPEGGAAAGGSGSGGTSTGGVAGAPQGGAGTGGVAVTGGAAGTAGTGGDWVIDDFEDGDGRSLVDTDWYAYDDHENGGGSRVTIGLPDQPISAIGEGFESVHSLLVEFTFGEAEPTAPYVGFGVALSSVGVPVDLSGFSGLAYTYQGEAHEVRIETSEVVDYDYHNVQVPASASWRTQILPFSRFGQKGWGTPVAFQPAHAKVVSWCVWGTPETTGSLLIDDLRIALTAQVE